MANYTAQQIDFERILTWRVGRPAELWLSYHELVGKQIRKYKLKPLPVDQYPYMPLAAEMGLAGGTAAKASSRFRWPVPFPGGIRIPHFHHGRDVYLVQQKQWNNFSNAIVRDIQTRLDKAGQVGFDETVQLAEAAVSLNR